MIPDVVPGDVPAWLRDVPLAHRGLHDEHGAENSLAAFKAAAGAGVGIELDVRLSADGVPVVVHDAVVAGPRGPIRVARSSRARLASLGVASLEQALTAARGTPVMVEVKNERRPGRLEAAVAQVLDEHLRTPSSSPLCVASFNSLTLQWFHRHHPDVVRVLTWSPGDPDVPPHWRWLVRSVRMLAQSHPAALSCSLEGLGDEATQRWRAGGGTVVTWTVRTTADLGRARELADNVIFESLPATAVRPAV